MSNPTHSVLQTKINYNRLPSRLSATAAHATYPTGFNLASERNLSVPPSHGMGGTPWDVEDLGAATRIANKSLHGGLRNMFGELRNGRKSANTGKSNVR